MKKLLSLALVSCLLLIAQPVFSAGDMVVTGPTEQKGVYEYFMRWTADSFGAVDVSSGSGAMITNASGQLCQVEVSPLSTNRPSDNYDILLYHTLPGGDEIDILNGDGANMDDGDDTSVTTANTYLHPIDAGGDHIQFQGAKIRAVISNAGSWNQGVIALRFKSGPK